MSTTQHHEPRPRPSLTAAVVGLALMLVAGAAVAAPQAHILRIDPRASMADGSPVLTTVVELVQNKPYSGVTSNCAELPAGNANLDCISEALLQTEALYTPLKWLDDNAYLLVSVDGRDMPTTFVSRTRWGESKADDGVGTAFLILIDAGASMGGRFPAAKAVAAAFVNSMTEHDIANVMFFNDSSIVKPSGWVSKAEAASHVESVTRTYPDQGRTRQLMGILKTGATDGFSELGNAGGQLDGLLRFPVSAIQKQTDRGAPSCSLAKLLRGGPRPEQVLVHVHEGG